jgi:hypothetical protein
MVRTKNTPEKFWKHVKKGKPNKCWKWTGLKDKDGYGKWSINYKSIRAHRYSYQIHKGNIPKNQHICHSCDNPSCVNPTHLWTGTPNDNIQDKVKKGRQYRIYKTETEKRKARLKTFKKSYQKHIEERRATAKARQQKRKLQRSEDKL